LLGRHLRAHSLLAVEVFQRLDRCPLVGCQPEDAARLILANSASAGSEFPGAFGWNTSIVTQLKANEQDNQSSEKAGDAGPIGRSTDC
jgi:hypothetical protein